MSTHVSIRMNKPSKLLWILTVVIVAVGLFFALVGLSEYYNVGIAGKGDSYAFGRINENQWYYQSEEIYANYNLVSGILFLIASILAIWAMVKKNKRLRNLGTLLLIVFLILELINRTIQ